MADTGTRIVTSDGRKGTKKIRGDKRVFVMDDGTESDSVGDYTEDAGNTVIGGKDRTVIQKADSSAGSGSVRHKPADAPSAESTPSLGLAARIANAKAQKATPSPSPTPRPKPDAKKQLSALLGDKRRA